MIKPFSPARVAPRRTRRMAGHAHVHVHHDVPTDASSRPLRAAAPQRCGALGASLRRAGSARPIAASDHADRCQRWERSLTAIEKRSLSAIAPIAVSDRFRRCQRSLRSLSAIHVSLSAIGRALRSDGAARSQRWRIAARAAASDAPSLRSARSIAVGGAGSDRAALRSAVSDHGSAPLLMG